MMTIGIETTMKALAAIIAMAFLTTCTSDAQTPKQVSRPVVIELFTSQGCSSCPPADRLLSKLRAEGNVIPLAYHVDYWNYIGWTDPFSSSAWSQRQRQYAQTLKSQVYTPQLVVNGAAQLVGSSERHVRAEIERQQREAERGAVFIDRIDRSGNQLIVHLRAQNDRRENLVVTLFENGLTTAVTRGENSDKQLANDAIVRWQAVASGPTITIPIDAKWRADHLGVAAYLQDPKSLAIHAATAKNL